MPPLSRFWAQAIRLGYKDNPGKAQKGLLTKVSQNSHKKTRAMAAQSCEDGVKVEGTRSKRNSKKILAIGLIYR